MTMTLTDSAAGRGDGGLRDRALVRLKKKSDLRAHLFVFCTVNAVLVAIWLLTGHGFFWPMFPLLGWGVGLIFNAWDVYRRQDYTEEQIQREIRHLR